MIRRTHAHAMNYAFALSVLGCSGRVIDSSTGAPPPTERDASATDGGQAGSPGARGKTGIGGKTGAGGSSGGADSLLDAAPPPDLLTKPTVWIGQLEHPVTYPLIDDQGPQRIVIILDAVTDASAVGGSVTFGSGPPPPAPASATDSFPPAVVALPENFGAAPYVGFSYSITWSDLKANHLTLSFVPSELFRDWCAVQSPRPGGYGFGRQFCQCSETACTTVTTQTRRIDLVVSGHSAQGAFANVTGDSGFPIQMRLERVQ
jgi:hypothetical protein